MIEAVFATKNMHKVDEANLILKSLLADGLLHLIHLPGLPDVEETGSTFSENALLKARAVSLHTNKASLADDSGLVVPVLNGEPGVHSARYAGHGASAQQMIEKLLFNMKDFHGEDRRAWFACVLALALPGQPVIYAEGRVEGTILEKPEGQGGFGYDPVFQPQGLSRSFALSEAAEKNKISHRGRAFAALIEILKKNQPLGGENPQIHWKN